MRERAVVVNVDWEGEDAWDPEASSEELRELVKSSGVEVASEVACRRTRPTPSLLIGRGKAEEVNLVCRQADANVVIFNEDLSSSQQRNLEEILQLKVIDRTQLILDIFAQRAHTQEGKVQVELAQLLYLLPRLTGKGILLSRLGGGIGTRGPGETKLEMDRRRIRKRVGRLEEMLGKLSRRRETLRKSRQVREVAQISLVGYTNAGKTTLLNTLTHAEGFVKDQLFSTLDPLTRHGELPNGQRVVFVDTVGFIHKLPHHLIEAFKATLEEVVEADVLIHVLDASHPRAAAQAEAVFEVLGELGAKEKPLITALNKTDRVEAAGILQRLLRAMPNSVAISALRGQGIEELLARAAAQLRGLVARVRVFIPNGKLGLLDRIYSSGRVLEREDRADGVRLQAEIPVRLKYLLAREDVLMLE